MRWDRCFFRKERKKGKGELVDTKEIIHGNFFFLFKTAATTTTTAAASTTNTYLVYMLVIDNQDGIKPSPFSQQHTNTKSTSRHTHEMQSAHREKESSTRE